MNGVLSVLTILCSTVFAQTDDQKAEHVENGSLYYMTSDQTYYRDEEGNPAEGYGYWPIAHGLQNFAAAYQRTRNTVYRDGMKSVLKGIRDYNYYQRGTYKNDYYDDLEWLGLACFSAYKATGDNEYIDAIHEIWGYIKTGFDDTRGVMAWRTGCNPACNNSIGNSPAIIMGLKLYQLEGDPANLDMAKRIYTWMKANVVNSDGAIWDGPDNFNPGWLFSYNQGMFIGAALMLNQVTGEQHYIDDAIVASEYIMNHKLFDPGVFYLNETGGGDGGLFKGIFARYFTEFVRLSNLNEIQKKRYYSVIRQTGDYVWKNGINKSTYIGGSNWNNTNETEFSSHQSAVHLFESIASLNKVHVYQDINYAGRYSQLKLGSYTTSQLQNWDVANNGITSFSIPVGYKIIVYENDNFTGASKTFTANTKWLADWNDRISSIQIEEQNSIVSLFNDIDFGGNKANLNVGEYTLTDLTAQGFFDNTLTSLSIKEGYKVIAYEDDNFSGNTTTYTQTINWIGNFNDKVSSIKVLPNGTANLENTYFIQNRASGLYMDVNGGIDATANGIAIIQTNFNGNTNQQFEITDKGNGAYAIVAKHSNKCLDVAGISEETGALIHQWDYLGSANQRFILVPVDNDYYKLIAEHTGMVAEASTTNNGEQLHQFDNHTNTSAHWKFLPADAILGNDHLQETISSLYPNPTNSKLHFNTSEATITIYDATGKSILSTYTTTNEIDVSTLKNGLYTIEFKTDETTRIEKFIKE